MGQNQSGSGSSIALGRKFLDDFDVKERLGGYPVYEIIQLWSAFDMNNDGVLDKKEFTKFFLSLIKLLDINQQDVVDKLESKQNDPNDEWVSLFDKNKDGVVEWTEIFPDPGVLSKDAEIPEIESPVRPELYPVPPPEGIPPDCLRSLGTLDQDALSYLSTSGLDFLSGVDIDELKHWLVERIAWVKAQTSCPVTGCTKPAEPNDKCRVCGLRYCWAHKVAQAQYAFAFPPMSGYVCKPCQAYRDASAIFDHSSTKRADVENVSTVTLMIKQPVAAAVKDALSSDVPLEVLSIIMEFYVPLYVITIHNKGGNGALHLGLPNGEAKFLSPSESPSSGNSLIEPLPFGDHPAVLGHQARAAVAKYLNINQIEDISQHISLVDSKGNVIEDSDTVFPAYTEPIMIMGRPCIQRSGTSTTTLRTLPVPKTSTTSSSVSATTPATISSVQIGSQAVIASWSRQGNEFKDSESNDKNIPDTIRSRLAHVWTSDGLAEHASIASFSRHILELMSVAAPPEIILAAQRAAMDEVKHAQLCFQLASFYKNETVEPSAFPIPTEGMTIMNMHDFDDCRLSHLSLDERRLALMTVGTIMEGCIEETLSGLSAAAAFAMATSLNVKQALSCIVTDEARHAGLAWRTVRWAVSKGGPSILSHALQAFDDAVQKEVANLEDLRTNPTRVLNDPERGLDASYGRLSPKSRHCVRNWGLQYVIKPWIQVFQNSAPERKDEDTIITDIQVPNFPLIHDFGAQVHKEQVNVSTQLIEQLTSCISIMTEEANR